MDAKAKKHRGDPDARRRIARQEPSHDLERKLEQGLEESMAGSDPVSITQPTTPKPNKRKNQEETERKRSGE
jgi:hypothetical protein